MLVLAVTEGSGLYKQRERQYVAEKLKPMMERGPKLREMMGAFARPLQLRALKAWALGPSKWRAVRMLARVPASALAQAIPAKPGQQVDWLRALGAWEQTMDRRFGDPYRLAAWAADRLRLMANDHTAAVSDLADFAGSDGAHFNEKWTLAQALAAAVKGFLKHIGGKELAP